MKTNHGLTIVAPGLQTRDILWKGMMEDLFADFLYFFFTDADNIFDIEKGFEFLDKELHEITPGEVVQHPRFVDKLVKVWRKDGSESWLLVHVEVQGYRDKHFPERMFTYFYRIRDKYQRSITSLAILTDNDEKYHPDKYEYDCYGTSLVFHFNTYKVKGQDVSLLEQSDNPFAIVILTILTALGQYEESSELVLASFLKLVRRLLEKKLPKEKIARLITFIKRYVNFGESSLFHKFEEEINIITKNPAHMGLYEQIIEIETEEAEARGEKRGQTIIVRNLLLETDWDIQKIARIAQVDIDFVINVKNSLAA